MGGDLESQGETVDLDHPPPARTGMAWWRDRPFHGITLIAIAELLEAQESPISGRQLDYLRRTLFGGMGSLNDLYFDSKAFGGPADFVNSSLEPRRRELYESFKTL